jgi:CRISPR/Cas system-associated exonuclease Cas4 (RecB family)
MLSLSKTSSQCGWIELGTVFVELRTKRIEIKRGSKMRSWRDKFQAMAAAVAFAQAGEWETAKSLLRKPIGKQIDRPATISRRPNRQARRLSFRF